MTTQTEIAHANTNEIVCPHCGYEKSNSWMDFLECAPECDMTVVCGRCREPFVATREVNVTYSTRKIGRLADDTKAKTP